MPVRATKKAQTLVRSVAAGQRRSGRPRTATASSRIYSDLRSELVSLRRRPGEAVSEAEIALAYGVSRTPVREAILKLSDEGLLDIFPQSGIFVSRIPVAALPEAIVIRRALEATTARLAAERASSSQILVLHSILERQREANAARENNAFHRADEMFHATIAEIAGYPGVWALIQQVKVHVDRYRLLTLPDQGHVARVIAEHAAILAAIETHDPAGARTAMEFHLDLERLVSHISTIQSINPDFFAATEPVS
jgi:DNA-binding GntR family transcriptional regulator